MGNSRQSLFVYVTLLLLTTLMGRSSSFMMPTGVLTRTASHSPKSLRMADTVVEFTVTGKTVTVPVGTPLSQLCAKNGVKVKYNCKEGHCKTCEINVDGNWVRACQGKVQSSRRIVKIRK